MTKIESCRSCGSHVVRNTKETSMPLCADCESKPLTLTVELNRVVVAELSSRPHKPIQFPNPYRLAGHDVIDGGRFLQALVKANGGNNVREAAGGN